LGGETGGTVVAGAGGGGLLMENVVVGGGVAMQGGVESTIAAIGGAGWAVELLRGETGETVMAGAGGGALLVENVVVGGGVAMRGGVESTISAIGGAGGAVELATGGLGNFTTVPSVS
jgi:hypothetical protein